MKNPIPGWLALITTVLATSVHGERFQLVSTIDPSQEVPPAGGSGDSSSAVMSADGRFVIFASTANNLVLSTNNLPMPTRIPAALNVFLRDRTNHTTTLVSVSLSGQAGGNADSVPIDVSSDGRFVLFESAASDLTTNDTNNATDVFVRDLVNATTTLVSINTNGVPGNGASRSSAMTPDARFVAFVSAANNLTPGDTNRIPDVFVRDIQGKTTVLASVGAVSTNSSIPSGSSEAPVITPDGHYVAFMSTATNLVSGVPAGGDVYIRDLVAGTTAWASTGARAATLAALGSAAVASFNCAISDDGQFVAYEAAKNPSNNGLILRYSSATGSTDVIHTNASVVIGPLEEARSLDMTPDGRYVAFVANTNAGLSSSTCICVWDGQSSAINVASLDRNGLVTPNTLCDWPTITPDGRYAAFLSSATNLTANSLVGTYHLYVRDLQAVSTVLIDADTNGIGCSVGPATIPRLSVDGRFAAFDATDGDLVANDSNRDTDLFVADLQAGSTELISAHEPTLGSSTPNRPSTAVAGAMSSDARFIAFASEADNLTAGDTNGCRDIFLKDFAGSAPVLVSINTNGTTGHGPSTDPVVSGDGRYVAFASLADDLVVGDNNHVTDVFVRDVQAGTTTLVSVNTNGTGSGNKGSYSPSLSVDGRYVLFRSLAGNLTAGTFSGENLFVRDLSSGVTYPLTSGGVAVAHMLPDASLVAFIGQATGSPSTNFNLWSSQSLTLVYTNSVDPLLSYRSIIISPGGHRVAYSCLGSGALGGRLYLTDLVAGTNTLIDTATSALYPGIRFSRDGLLLAYTKTVNSANQLCLYDVEAGVNRVLAQSSSTPGMPVGSANALDISPDGRFIAYRSTGTNIFSTATNNLAQIFLFDRQTGTNLLLTVSRFPNAAADNFSFAPQFSDDGQTLLFQSWASDLAPQDFNHSSDLLAMAFFYVRISETNSSAGGPRLSWPAVPGSNYRVQFTDRLPDGTWQDLNASITNFANKAWLVDPLPGVGQRFYRAYAF